MSSNPDIPDNKHILFLVLLRSVLNGSPLTMDEFRRCSDPELGKSKPRDWYWRWLQQMHDGEITTVPNRQTLEAELVKYGNQKLANLNAVQRRAIDQALSRRKRTAR
jgi:hypothetical protein